MKLWSIEGNRQHLDGGSMFGSAPRTLWEKWIKPDARHRVELACRCLLAENLNNKTVLFEAGMGAFLEPRLADRFGLTETKHRLLLSLQEAGYTHEDIDVVVLSHLHFDHIGGLFSQYHSGKSMELLFPNATFIISADAWDTAKNPHLRDKPSFIKEQVELLEKSGRVALIDGEHHDLLGPDVKFYYSNGHTRGLLISEIGGRDGIAFAADLIPGTIWVHLPLTMGYDRFPEQVIDEKLEFMQTMIDRNVRLFYTHDPEFAVSDISRDANGKFVASNKKPVIAALTLQ